MEKLLNKLCNKTSNISDLKNDSYDLIFVIVDYLVKIIYYKPVKVIINLLNLLKIIINIVI